MKLISRIWNLKHGLIATFLFSALAIPHSSFSVESPLYIPFQGQVTNQTGTLATDGQYSVIFNLYDQAVGGQPVWSERHVKIGVTRGMINVFLGSISPLTSVDFSQTKYLGITVDTDNLATTADPEMVPRSLIMPAFHAKKAENSTKLAGNDWATFFVNSSGIAINDPATGFLSGSKVAAGSIANAQLGTDAVTTGKVQDSAITTSKIANNTITVDDLSTALRQASVIPPGTIMAFAGQEGQLPAGWLLCDGSALKSTNPTYTALHAAISNNWGNGSTTPTGAVFPAIAAGAEQTNFNIPDLRGYFLRGVDASNGIAQGRDPDASTRTATRAGGATGNIVGSVQNDEFKSHTHSAQGKVYGGSGGLAFSAVGGGGYPFTDQVVSSTGGSETRPKNAYVNYIIKY